MVAIACQHPQLTKLLIGWGHHLGYLVPVMPWRCKSCGKLLTSWQLSGLSSR